MKTKPGALIITGYGINCDYESAAACEGAGFRAERVHVNDLIHDTGMLGRYRLVVFPGGFSYGDDLGSGVAFALKVRFAAAGGPGDDGGKRLCDSLLEFREAGGLILGICNGFQVLVRLGLVPGLDDLFEQQVTIAPNRCWYFIDRWVHLKSEPGSPCVFTRGTSMLRMPVRHGEGRLLAADAGVLERLEREGRVVLRYCTPGGEPADRFPDNPNGSDNAIAGICDSTGRVFGLMPHPEAAVSLYQYPDWTGLVRGSGGVSAENAGSAVPGSAAAAASASTRGSGHTLFENAYQYLA
jgi:phosphoribosylformylglycinamidine synthase